MRGRNVPLLRPAIIILQPEALGKRRWARAASTRVPPRIISEVGVLSSAERSFVVAGGTWCNPFGLGGLRPLPGRIVDKALDWLDGSLEPDEWESVWRKTILANGLSGRALGYVN